MTMVSSSSVNALRNVANKYDPISAGTKQMLLSKLETTKLSANKLLINYHEVLLFIIAFPPNSLLLAFAEKELFRISEFLKKSKLKTNVLFENSGLPFTYSLSCFSAQCDAWLLLHPDCSITLNALEGTIQLSDVLKVTLPSLERSETTVGYDQEELLEALAVTDVNQLQFLMNELKRFDSQPLVKDHFFEGLGVHIWITPKNKNYSRSYNRITRTNTFYHTEILKRFDHVKLLDLAIGAPKKVTIGQQKELVLVIKNSMALTNRETDPITYLDEESLRFYELDRGLSVAIYGMQPHRQMPLESYIGYTLFKNGFPAAYGGGWVFAQRAGFGINIFEAYRGGESGYMLIQLLRVYRQVFAVEYFEIEPYQYGLDNPDGIASGAYWFYYRFGFRSLDKSLKKLADAEFSKISTSKSYRSSTRVLERFTESNVALNLGTIVPKSVYDITEKVMQMIRKQYKGNRQLAEETSVAKFRAKIEVPSILTVSEIQVQKEVALWAEALAISDKNKLVLMVKMIRLKPKDVYKYQQTLLEFFEIG